MWVQNSIYTLNHVYKIVSTPIQDVYPYTMGAYQVGQQYTIPFSKTAELYIVRRDVQEPYEESYFWFIGFLSRKHQDRILSRTSP